MPYPTPELRAKIDAWRRRADAGNPLTLEEQIEAIRYLREDRAAAAASSEAAKRKVAKAAIPDAEDLLKSLDDF